jgi:four helix bundle protein
MKKSYRDIAERTFNFAICVIKLVKSLPPCAATFEMGKQIIGSATSIDSNVIQARSGVSKKDFINHIKIARKEAKETKRWIQMMIASELATLDKAQSLLDECEEIISILVTIAKNAEKSS